MKKEELKINEGAVESRKLHTTYYFTNLKLAQYIIVFNLSATAPKIKLFFAI